MYRCVCVCVCVLHFHCLLNNSKNTGAISSNFFVGTLETLVLFCTVLVLIRSVCVPTCYQMSEVVEFELKPQPDTSLSHMIEYGLSKHLDR